MKPSHFFKHILKFLHISFLYQASNKFIFKKISLNLFEHRDVN